MTAALSSTTLLLDALRFAAAKHRDQRRKGRDASPFINHPIDVAHLLATVGGVTDVEILVAAVLHDTVEDTRTTPAEIEENFGAAVRLLVEEMTDDKNLSKAERKRLQIVKAPHISPRAKLIKIADKICNVRDIAASPPVDWSVDRRAEYFDWAERVVDGVRGSSEMLEAYFDESLRVARDTLARAQAVAEVDAEFR